MRWYLPDSHPLLWNELRGLLRSKVLRWLVLFDLLACVCYLIYFYDDAPWKPEIFSGSTFYQECWPWVFPLQVVLLLVILIPLSVSTVARERQIGTLDALLLTNCSEREFVLAKLTGILAKALPILLLGATIALITLYSGGISLHELLYNYLCLLFLALQATASGLYFAWRYALSWIAIPVACAYFVLTQICPCKLLFDAIPLVTSHSSMKENAAMWYLVYSLVFIIIEVGILALTIALSALLLNKMRTPVLSMIIPDEKGSLCVYVVKNQSWSTRSTELKEGLRRTIKIREGRIPNPDLEVIPGWHTMEIRKLGQTGLEVGAVGLGTEYLIESRETIVAVVHEALGHGMNFFDLLMAAPDNRDAYAAAFHGIARERLVLTGHLGTIFTEEGQGWASRDVALCAYFFEDQLTRLHTDYLDVVMLQFVDEEEDYARVMSADGLLELARNFKQQGKARAIGMSSHMTPMALAAVESGVIDVLMFPINPAFDVLPGYNKRFMRFWEDAGTFDVRTVIDDGPSRKDLYRACARHEVGLVAMKPYAAGWLFKPELFSTQPLTPVHCLGYALAQPGVSTVVPGVQNLDELRAALRFLEATPEEKDYSSAVANSRWNLTGACMYCNHCMPCPSGLDIAAVNRLIDAAARGVTPALRERYHQLPKSAANCLACGACSSICPFAVDVAAKMREGKELFA